MPIDNIDLDAARAYLASLAQDGNLSLEDALDTVIAGTRLGDIPEISAALTEMAADGTLSVDDVLSYVSSHYTVTGDQLVPKGTGDIGDVQGIDLEGLSNLAQLMLLLLRQAAEQRKTGQELRLAQSEAILNELFDAAENLRNGAITAMALGIAAGVAGIIGGAAGVLGGAKGLSAEAIQSINALASGLSTLLKSTGDGVQGILGADAKEDEAEAEKIRASREAEGDTIANLKDFIQTTLQLIQTMLEKENETLGQVLV